MVRKGRGEECVELTSLMNHFSFEKYSKNYVKMFVLTEIIENFSPALLP